MIETVIASSTSMWWASLAFGLVVTLVVALLLYLLYREATRIDTVVADIWEAGQRVANNTIHIPALYKTDAAVQAILSTAGSIAQGTGAIQAHAKGCPGCPQCMWTH